MLSLLILPPPQVLLNALWSRPTSSSIRKLSIDLTKGKIRSSAFANAGVKIQQNVIISYVLYYLYNTLHQP